MALKINCSKCGVTMNIDDETLETARTLNVPLPTAHKECPRDKVIQPVYVVTTTVERYESYDTFRERTDGVKLASYGGHIESPTFEEALSAIEQQATEQWAQVRGMSAAIEDDLEGDHNG